MRYKLIIGLVALSLLTIPLKAQNTSDTSEQAKEMGLDL